MESVRSSVQFSESDLQTRMQFSSNVRTLCSRVQTMLRQRRRKHKRSLQISAPFNLKREPVILPGVSEDEISMLREKAAASCIGIADPILLSQRSRSPRSPRSSPCGLFSHPVRPVMASGLSPRLNAMADAAS